MQSATSIIRLMPANREEALEFAAKVIVEVKVGDADKDEIKKHIVAITEALFLIHESL